MRSLILTSAVLCVAILPAGAGENGGGLAARLKTMPANSWLKLGLPWRGGNEVPAVFDQANGLFWKYGGCGDKSARVRISFPKGDSRYPNGYSNSCWAVEVKTGGWRQIRDYDCSWPKDRPANGCSRGYCYDGKRKLIWMYGGISDGGGGGDQWDLWSYDAASDKFTETNSTSKRGKPAGGDGNGGDVMVYDSANDLVMMYRGPAKGTWLYSPANNRWQNRPAPGGPPATGHYGNMVFDPSAKKVVCPVAEPTGKTSAERPKDTPKTLWRRNRKKIWCEYAQQTWTYDAAVNRWEKLAVKDENPSPSPRWRVGLTYDTKNGVVILVGGSTSTWDADEKTYGDVWILKTAEGKWTPANAKGGPSGRMARECRHCAYDEADNVVFFLNARTGCWAYRYR